MPCASYLRKLPHLAFALSLASPLLAQDAAKTPVSIPAGAIPAQTKSAPAKTTAVSARQAREADDAYLEGAKQLERDDLASAEKSFARAAQLDPTKQEYALSLTVAREHHLTELVQAAAKARLLGDDTKADDLIRQARAYDPDNSVVTQHLGLNASLPPSIPVEIDKLRANIPVLDGPIELEPTPGTKDLHHRGSAQDVIRQVYSDFGITATFDSSFTSNVPVKFDLDNVDFATATHALSEMTHCFAVAMQPKAALVAKNDADARERLMPLIEETIYLPGLANDAMTELANLARNVFDLKQVTASSTGGYIIVRGDEHTLHSLNEIYADMVDGGSDVLLDVHLYEYDKSHLVNIGANAPTSISGFPIVTTAVNLINQNQSVIAQAVSSGLLKLTGTAAQQQLEQLEFLIGSGIISSSQFTNLLGVLGTFGGLPLLGVSLGSTGTFDLMLNVSDVRMLDQVELRAGNNEELQFRAGTRYPIVTATYSSGVSSGLASQLAGVSVNGQSASSLLAQYGGASNVTVPQVQYEDLGITIKATPKILRTQEVNVKLDMKIEALGSGSLNTIPVLNNRVITSTVTIPTGQTALMASAITRNELRDIAGIPYLSELPGFQGTDKSTEIDTDELLVTITPHIVRQQRFRITSRRILVDHAPSAAAADHAPSATQ
jgi:general secretion pathway protein D